MAKLNVVILGDGLLGSEIEKQTKWNILSRKLTDFDINDLEKSFSGLDKIDIIINCIANTDTYSNDKKTHWDVNYVFVNNLIKYCNSNIIKLVHISTDYVYSGSIDEASEDDVPVHCNNWYGYTKLLADGLVQLEANDYLLIRCTHKPYPFPYEQAWVDQVGNFDYVNEIAYYIIKMVRKNLNGLYNVGTETKTMFDLASKSKSVKSISAPKHVPKNTTMNLSKLISITTDGIKKPFFSIAIPTYGYDGKGVEFLDYSLEIISKQTFKDFEVVISDHSVDDTIKNVCKRWEDKFKIKYFRNEYGRGVISPNINVAMRHCDGKWIKILFQDDFLNGDVSLDKHFNFIKNNSDVKWFAGYTHVTNDGFNISWSFQPRWVDDLWTGNNKLGCPSNITIINKDLIFFDEEFNWLMDVEYYMRMRKKFGDIKILPEYVIVNRTSDERLSNKIPESVKNLETEKLKKIYG